MEWDKQLSVHGYLSVVWKIKENLYILLIPFTIYTNNTSRQQWDHVIAVSPETKTCQNNSQFPGVFH
jgi:hypothetical protein